MRGGYSGIGGPENVTYSQLLKRLQSIGAEDDMREPAGQGQPWQVYRRVPTPMLKAGRSAFFAVGLAVGLGTALLFLVWAVPEFRNPLVTFEQPQQQHESETSQPKVDGGDRVPKRVYWGLFTLDDSVAQWGMALFSIAGTFASIYAVLLLRDTLRANTAAVDQATEANRIVRLEQRAWLAIKSADIVDGLFFRGVESSFTLSIKVRNVGKLPAKAIHFDVRAATIPSGQRPLVGLLDEVIKRGPPSPLLILNHMQNSMRRRPGQKGTTRDHGPMLFPSDKTRYRRTAKIDGLDLDKARGTDPKVMEVLVYVCIDYLIAGDIGHGSKQTAIVYQLEKAVRSEAGDVQGFSREINIDRDMPATDLRVVPYRFAAHYSD